MNKDPIRQFKLWFEEASASGVSLPEAACLSTVGVQGFPEGRMILLKECDDRGFVFYTNIESRKAKSLELHPQAALTFYWDPFRWQVRIRGPVEPVSPSEADEYFQTRPRDSQLGAWASAQSEPLDSRETLEKRFKEFEKKFQNRPVPRPPHWSGYRLIPQEVEFWIGRENRLHDRFLYTKAEDGWSIQRLYP